MTSATASDQPIDNTRGLVDIPGDLVSPGDVISDRPVTPAATAG